MSFYLGSIVNNLDRFQRLTASKSLTYNDLKNLSHSFAAYWSENSSEETIAIASDNSNEMLMAAVLGAWLCGKSVLPISRLESSNRIQTILREFGLTSFFFFEGSPVAQEVSILPSARIPTPKANPQQPKLKSTLDSVAYHIYTSGSAGSPKKIAIRHRQLDAWIKSANEFNHQPVERCILGLFAWSFDMWFMPMVVGLLNGMRVVTATTLDAAIARPFGALDNIYAIALTPTQAKFVARSALANTIGASVKRTFFCGELLEGSLVAAWKAKFPNTTIENLYGPAETTLSIFHHRLDANTPLLPQTIIPIGLPHRGLATFIDQDQLLWVAGEQVAIDQRTAPPAIMPPPIPREPIWYNTGDIATVDSAGNFVVHGRADNLIKINGGRINLEEIEAAFSVAGLPAVFIQDPTNKEVIGIINSKYSRTEIESAIVLAAEKLPPGVSPKKYCYCARLPMNTSCKVDRKTLLSLYVSDRLEGAYP